MNFTLAEAAQKVGISRSSIYRLIDEGKLSASTDRRGKKVVELSELLRVFGSIQEETESDKTQENKRTTQYMSQELQERQDKTRCSQLCKSLNIYEHSFS